jgi:hypothetical protein
MDGFKMNTRVLADTTTLAALVVVFDYTIKYPNLNARAIEHAPYKR